MTKAMKSVVVLIVLFALAAADPIYVENFDVLDRNDWNIEIVSNPHNNELQYYTDRPENIKAEGGKLVITPLRENYGGRQWTSGRMYSKFHWKYGRVEVRAKLPNGFGLWPAIWMLPEYQVFGGWPQSGEIDIMEARGQNNHEFASTIHFGDVCCENHFWETSGDLPTQCNNDQYHVYTLDWTPTQLVYRFDGKAHHVHDLDRVIGWMYSQNGDPFHEYFHLVLNVAVGGDYLENPTPNTQYDYPDAEMWVDYVKVYPIEDIATYSCAMKPGSDPFTVCGTLEWACNDQSYADVSAECTAEMYSCCSSPTACDSATLNKVASAIYASYDAQVNDANSCNFDGTAERKYVLNDGDLSDLPPAQCLIKDSANPYDICGSMQWTCYDQNYADVSAECNQGSDVLSCCGVDAMTCDQSRLQSAAELVFQAYYNAIPSASSCDFGGVCYLESSLLPLACTDGFGG